MKLNKLTDGIWVIEGNRISFLTFPYEIRATVVDLGGGELLVHSPVQIEAASLLNDLPGQVKYIVSPNKLHSLFLEDWQKVYPQAKIYAPPGLMAKRPQVAFYKELTNEPEPEWRHVLDQTLVQGSWFMSEVVFFHKSSGSLILGDLIENHDPKKLGWIYRVAARAVAILAPKGTTARIFRWTFIHRKITRPALQEILNWNVQRVIVNHGPIVETNAHAFLQNAFQWALE